MVNMACPAPTSLSGVTAAQSEDAAWTKTSDQSTARFPTNHLPSVPSWHPLFYGSERRKGNQQSDSNRPWKLLSSLYRSKFGYPRLLGSLPTNPSPVNPTRDFQGPNPPTRPPSPAPRAVSTEGRGPGGLVPRPGAREVQHRGHVHGDQTRGDLLGKVDP